MLFFFYSEKYEYVGRLLRPGEQPTSYSDEEDETTGSESKNSKDDIKNINSSEAAPAPADKPKDEWPNKWQEEKDEKEEKENTLISTGNSHIITERLSFIDILFNHGPAKPFNNYQNNEFDANGTNNERKKP